MLPCRRRACYFRHILVPGAPDRARLAQPSGGRMRRIVAGFGLFGLLLVVPTRPAVAQMRGYFGAGAGIAIPTGDFADAVKTGWIGHVIGRSEERRVGKECRSRW